MHARELLAVPKDTDKDGGTLSLHSCYVNFDFTSVSLWSMVLSLAGSPQSFQSKAQVRTLPGYRIYPIPINPAEVNAAPQRDMRNQHRQLAFQGRIIYLSLEKRLKRSVYLNGVIS